MLLKTESLSFLFLPRTRLWGFLFLVDVDMEAARIYALPDEGFYISDFITEDEEDLLLQKALKYVCNQRNTCANMIMLV